MVYSGLNSGAPASRPAIQRYGQDRQSTDGAGCVKVPIHIGYCKNLGSVTK
jgi:hypothetical protein